MIFYNSECCTVRYFEKEKLIFTQYHDFTSSDELKQILKAVLVVNFTREVEMVISDNRKMKVIRPSDQEYITNIWFPEFLKNKNIKKFAVIESEDIFNKISVEDILKKAGQLPFDMHFFNSLEKSCNWLDIDCSILSK